MSPPATVGKNVPLKKQRDKLPYEGRCIMKNTLIKPIIFLIACLNIIVITLLFSTSFVLAGNSYSIAVSCTIPAIPGVNVPLIQEKTAKPELNNNSAATDQNANLPQEEINNTPAMFQKDTEEVRWVEGEKDIVTLKTIYSR